MKEGNRELIKHLATNEREAEDVEIGNMRDEMKTDEYTTRPDLGCVANLFDIYIILSSPPF